MILLGFIHLTGLQVSGLLTGLLAIQGSVFCSHPTLIYVAGAVGVGRFFINFGEFWICRKSLDYLDKGWY